MRQCLTLVAMLFILNVTGCAPESVGEGPVSPSLIHGNAEAAPAGHGRSILVVNVCDIDGAALPGVTITATTGEPDQDKIQDKTAVTGAEGSCLLQNGATLFRKSRSTSSVFDNGHD